MSTYIVQDRTINNVTSWLRFYTNERTHLRQQIIKFAGTLGENWLDEFGARMHELNVQAVNARYGEGENAKFRSGDFQSQLRLAVTPVQAYKSLQCWLYQCSEGDVPTTPLFHFCRNEIKPLIADEIIHRLDGYEKANWDD